MKSFQPLSNETTVQTFERIVERLSLLQSQLPRMYHNDQAMVDKLHDLIHGQPFESSIISQNEKNPHQLIDKIKFALHSAPAPKPNSNIPGPLSALIVDNLEDDVEVDIEQFVDDEDPNTVYFVLRKYNRNSTRSHFTKRYRRRPFKRPSAEHPCGICGSRDHWAREHHKSRTRSRQHSQFSQESPPESTLDPFLNYIPTFTNPVTTLPNDLSSLIGSAYNTDTTGSATPPQHQSCNFIPSNSFLAPSSHSTPPSPSHEQIRSVFHTSASNLHNKFPVMDSGTFADLMGTAWVRANNPKIVSQTRPSKTTFSFGNDRHPTVACVSIQLNCKDLKGELITFVLTDVNIVDNTPAPLLFGYQSQAKYDLLTRPHNNTIIKILPAAHSSPIQVIQGELIAGHLCLITEETTNCLYTRQELSLIHRQFGHKLVADVLKSFPQGTFSGDDIKLMTDIAASCKPCREHAQLPRRPRYTLPKRPIYFNRLIQADIFIIAGQHHPVLDITCNDTDFGLGIFLENKSAEMLFALLYIKWFTVIGLPETVIGDRGGEFENRLLTDGLASLGVVYRFAPTEAPWSIGRVERHHAPIRKAFLTIMAETPRLNTHLALAMAYKSRNDTPRSHGISPHQAAFGEVPRLLVGDNTHSTPEIASRHKAMQTARAAMEAFIAKDRLKKSTLTSQPQGPFCFCWTTCGFP